MNFRRRLLLILPLIIMGFAGMISFSAGWAAEEKITAAPAQSLGIGAIGQIEPRSRVLKLSHDQGPEGARIEKVLVSEGQTVAADETLVVFSDHTRRQSELETAEAQLKAISARLESFQAEKTDAETDFKRYKSLLGSAAISRAAYDRALARLNTATAELQAAQFDIETAGAEARLAAQKILQSSLRAPFAGTVLKIHAWPGERVGDAQIMDFADLTKLDIVAEVYENDLPRLRVGQQADVMLPGIAKTYQASVREIGFLVRKNDLNDTDPLADTDNRVIEVRLTLDEAAIDDLRHQIYRQVQVQIKP